MIEILLDAEGYRPIGVEIIVLQPMEIILLKLRIASQIALAAFINISVRSCIEWSKNNRRRKASCD